MGNQNSVPVPELVVDNPENKNPSAGDQPDNNNSTTSIQPFDAEEFFSFLQYLPEDEKLNEILELSNRLISQKPELVQKIRKAEESLLLHHRNVTISKITGSSVGIASGVCFIAGIALAPVTFGASLGLTIGGGIGGLAGGATFVGADLAGNKLINEELEKIQSELNDFHKELEVLSNFDHEGVLAQQVKHFGETLVELEGLSETEFVTFLKKTYQAITKYLKTSLNKSNIDIQLIIDAVTDDKRIWGLVKQFLIPFLDKKARADLERLRIILKLLIDSAPQIYCYVKKTVHFIIPLNNINKELLPVGTIVRGASGAAIAGFKVASEAGQVVTKIAPQILKGLGYAAGGVAIVVDLGFLIHTCVTMNDVPHVGTLRSLADQMDEMDLAPRTCVTIDDVPHIDETLADQTDLESVCSSEYFSCDEE